MNDRREAVLDIAKELISRPSENPPGEEATVAEWLGDRFVSSPIAFDVDTTLVEPGRPNVVARAGNPENGTVLLTGHMDVVPADPQAWIDHPYEPTVRDGRLVGRGSADMKGAIAGMIVAAERYLDRIADPVEVVLAFVVDEEHGGTGTEQLIKDGLTADVAIIGEPTELNVCTATKGVSRYRVSIAGDGCHSGTPDEGRDAIRALAGLLERIATLDAHLEATSHDVLQHEDSTVTEVEGGLAPNVVAGEAAATVDWRFLPGPTSPDSFDERLNETLAGLSADGDPVDVDITRTVFARASETDPAHPSVKLALQAANQAGIDASVVGFNAATDARFLVHDGNISTVHIGPGSLTGDAHTVDESVSVDDLVAASAIYEHLLEEFR